MTKLSEKFGILSLLKAFTGHKKSTIPIALTSGLGCRMGSF